jgi:hypothetical protein
MSNQVDIQKTIIEELGLSDLSREKQEKLVIKMTEAVLKRVFLETIEKLSVADQENFSQMIGNKAAPEQLEKFLSEKINDYDEMVKKIVEDFKEEMKK